MGVKDKVLYFNNEKFKQLEKNGSVIFTSTQQYKWFKTTITGKDILLKIDGKKSVKEVAKEIAIEYELPIEVIEKDIYNFCKISLDNGIIYESKEDEKEIELNKNIKSVYIEVTNQCNLKCKYCNSNNCFKEEAKFLDPETLEEYLKKITSINNNAPILVNLTGGEPLLNTRIEELFKVIREYDCRISLSTNGLLLTEEKADLIKEYCDFVMLSLDSKDKEVNDMIRGEGSYEAVISSAKICREREITFFISATPTKYNIENLEKLISFTYDLEADGFMINEPILLDKEGNSLKEHFNYSLDKLESKKAFVRKRTAIINSWKNDRLKYNKKDKVNLIFIEDIKRCMNSVFNIIPKANCGAGVNEILIDINGIVYPCHALNVAKYALGTVEEYTSNKKDFIKIDDINECKDCNLNIFCLGGCRAQSLFHNKDIYSKYPSCKYEKENYEQILWSPLKPIELKEK